MRCRFAFGMARTMRSIRGARILVVEDEALIALVLGDVLDMVGATVVGVGGSVDEALELVATTDFDVAILDVNLGSEAVFPVADAIAARGIAMIFATGSGREALPERFRAATLIDKPYATGAVEAALEAALPESISAL